MKRCIVALMLGYGLVGCASGRDLADSEDGRMNASDDEDDPAKDGGNEGDDGGPGNKDSGDDEPGDAPSDDEPGDAPSDDEPASGHNTYEDDGREFTYYADAKPIIDSKCTACHFKGGIGPMPLKSYDDVKPFVQLMRATVAAGIMPPWRAQGSLKLYEGDRRLTEEQQYVLVRWIDQGAPEGDKDDEPEAQAPIARGLPRVDLELKMDESYTPTMEPDNYRCFALQWPYEETKYITGLGVEPGSLKMVHHALVYLVQPENAAAMIEQDEAGEGAGWNCSSGSSGLSAWLTSYEPGGFGQEIPGKLGYAVEPGSVLLLQIHYNTLNGKESDRSSVQFMVEDEAERKGSVALLMQPTWPIGFMEIPANQPDVVHTYRGRPTQLNNETTYDLFWADLHMHQLASRGGIGIIRANAPDKVEPLLEILDWAFEWQETFIFQKPVKLYPGDQLMVECHYDNTAQNQIVVDGQRLTPRDVNWGEGTTDEMCLGNVLTAPEVR